ncbi:MAG TPA: biotin/lipoyl-containing protein [Chloroflexota bacterium]|nr:biotin/lipoyl-containing protein [Chloroflexota bacterium]
MKYLASVNGEEFALDIQRNAAGSFTVIVNGHSHEVDVQTAGRGWLHSLLVGGRSFQINRVEGGLELDGQTYAVEIQRDLGLAPRVASAAAAGPAILEAPISGLVVALRAKPGDLVQPGQPLLILEAMKMQMELKSPRGGKVASIAAQPGREVAQGQQLAVISD